MDQIGLNRISHLSKNVTIKIFTFTTRINGHFFWIIIGSNLSKMAQTGSTRSKMGKTPRSWISHLRHRLLLRLLLLLCLRSSLRSSWRNLELSSLWVLLRNLRRNFEWLLLLRRVMIGRLLWLLRLLRLLQLLLLSGGICRHSLRLRRLLQRLLLSDLRCLLRLRRSLRWHVLMWVRNRTMLRLKEKFNFISKNKKR